MTIHQTTIRPAVTPAEQRFLDLYADVSGKLAGARSAAVRAWRDAARDAFIMQGVPHRRVEEWKYTDLRALMPEVHPLSGLEPKAAADVSVEAAIGKSLAHLDAYRAVFVGGRFRADLSTIQNAPDVGFETLRQVLEEDDASAAAVAKLSLPKRDVVAALSTVFATDGAIISVAAGAKLEKPIHVIVIAQGGNASVGASACRQRRRRRGCFAYRNARRRRAGQAISHTRLAIGARRIAEACPVDRGKRSEASGFSRRHPWRRLKL